jgi:hypothetical protein
MTAVLVLLIVVAPMVHFILTDANALKRAQATSIFTNNQELLKPSVERLITAKKSDDIVGILINNRRVVYTQTMIKNYFSHFNPQWLFITGDSPRHHAPGMGLLYLWELPFLLIGVGAIIGRRQSFLPKNNKFFLLGWLILTPLPAIITNDVPHAVRTLNFLPTFQIITAIGLLKTYMLLKGRMVHGVGFKSVLYLIPCILYLVFTVSNIGYFLYQYFVRTNLEYATEWQYGYKEAVAYVHQHEDNYKNIVVSNQVPLDQSYIFFLFYLKYPPQLYQHEVARYINKPIRGFDKYEFRPVDIQNIDFAGKETLYMVSSKNADVTNPVHTVTNPDGTPAIYLIEGK